MPHMIHFKRTCILNLKGEAWSYIHHTKNHMCLEQNLTFYNGLQMKLNAFEYVPEDVIISGITRLFEVSEEHLISVSTRLKAGTERCSFSHEHMDGY